MCLFPVSAREGRVTEHLIATFAVSRLRLRHASHRRFLAPFWLSHEGYAVSGAICVAHNIHVIFLCLTQDETEWDDSEHPITAEFMRLAERDTSVEVHGCSH